MKITDVRLLIPKDCSYFNNGGISGNINNRGWVSRTRVANPMSIYPAYAEERVSWMGPGQEHYAVEIETDTGHVGVCANYYGGSLACQIIHSHYRRFLIGADPFDTELLWQQMYRASVPYGLGALTGMAQAGVDIALWDLKGKILNRPVYQLIGGATKPDGIPCYITTHPDYAKHWKDKGFLGVKIAAPYGIESGRNGILKMEKIIRELREAVGAAMEIMIDCYMSWGLEFTCRVAERVRDCDVKWFEDALPNGWEAKQYAELRRRVSPILITNGNMEYHYKAIHDLIESGATDVIQPELHWVGGLTPSLWITAFARPYQIPVVPHGASVYLYHLIMATTDSHYAEFVAGGDGTEIKCVFELLLDQPIPVNGRMHLPDTPGFGVRLNHELLRPFTLSKSII
jgi:L-rhamnonate dehydratase